MGFLTKFIPPGYQWLATLVVYGIVALAGLTLGIKMTAANYKPKLEAQTARADAQKLRADQNVSAYLIMAKTAAAQNASILNLESESNARMLAANKSAREAKIIAMPHRDLSNKYLGLKHPANNQCEYAKGLIDEYVKVRSSAVVDSVRINP